MYSTLLFSPPTQTCYSEGEDELEFFDEDFLGYALPRLLFLWCYGVFRCFVLFRMRVTLVFRDIIYVINILYS
jgi:hypothetical protein